MKSQARFKHMSFLRFEHIKKIYPNGFEAVKDFCLDVEKGEFIVLVAHQVVVKQQH